MSEVHKKFCDVCGKEKDLNDTYFGGMDTWQFLYTQEHGQRVKKDACSLVCALKLFEKFVKEAK